MFYKIWYALCNVLKFKNLYDFHPKRSKKLTIVYFLTIWLFMWISGHGLVKYLSHRMQRNNRVFTKEYDPEKRRQLLIEATDSKPWRLKLKKRRRGKDS